MANRQGSEFEEIAHSGGRIIIRVVTQPDSRRSYQLEWQHCRPVTSAIIAVYALPQGIVVDTVELGGIGQPWNTPPNAGCVPVFIGSDSHGKFGRQCPACSGYWRTAGRATICPYCGCHARAHEFLTMAQRVYVARYCKKLIEALDAEADGEHVIDMDAVADAAGKETDKPPFYYAEESQQNQFLCEACGSFNDILGKFGYCSVCGARNDLQELADNIIEPLRRRIKDGGPYQDCVRDAVSAFDSFAGRYARELVRLVPMTPGRTARFKKRRFHRLKEAADDFKAIFDIDVMKDIDSNDQKFALRLFHRRQIYEHKGGEVDEKYIAESGDNSVRLGQALQETKDSTHRLASLVLKMAKNLHGGFHAIFPPEAQPIQEHRNQKAMGQG